jgi:Excalibur calcium-binding domain
MVAGRAMVRQPLYRRSEGDKGGRLIAAEKQRCPAVRTIFMDLPSSGLDAFSTDPHVNEYYDFVNDGDDVKRITLSIFILFVIAPAARSDGCDENYANVCVPIASDVDCAGGSGNGPAYVDGPVFVVGRDVYGLDRDGDGVACER